MYTDTFMKNGHHLYVQTVKTLSLIKGEFNI